MEDAEEFAAVASGHMGPDHEEEEDEDEDEDEEEELDFEGGGRQNGGRTQDDLDRRREGEEGDEEAELYQSSGPGGYYGQRYLPPPTRSSQSPHRGASIGRSDSSQRASLERQSLERQSLERRSESRERRGPLLNPPSFGADGGGSGGGAARSLKSSERRSESRSESRERARGAPPARGEYRSEERLPVPQHASFDPPSRSNNSSNSSTGRSSLSPPPSAGGRTSPRPAPAWANHLKSSNSPPPTEDHHHHHHSSSSTSGSGSAIGKTGNSPRRPPPSVPKGRSQSAKRVQEMPMQGRTTVSSYSSGGSGSASAPFASKESKRTSRSEERSLHSTAGGERSGRGGPSSSSSSSSHLDRATYYSRPSAALGSPDRGNNTGSPSLSSSSSSSSPTTTSTQRAMERAQLIEATLAAELAAASASSLASGSEIPALAHRNGRDSTEVHSSSSFFLYFFFFFERCSTLIGYTTTFPYCVTLCVFVLPPKKTLSVLQNAISEYEGRVVSLFGDARSLIGSLRAELSKAEASSRRDAAAKEAAEARTRFVDTSMCSFCCM